MSYSNSKCQGKTVYFEAFRQWAETNLQKATVEWNKSRDRRKHLMELPLNGDSAVSLLRLWTESEEHFK